MAIVDTGPPGPVTRHGQGHQPADSLNITVMPQQSVQRRGPHSDGESGESEWFSVLFLTPLSPYFALVSLDFVNCAWGPLVYSSQLNTKSLGKYGTGKTKKQIIF